MGNQNTRFFAVQGAFGFSTIYVILVPPPQFMRFRLVSTPEKSSARKSFPVYCWVTLGFTAFSKGGDNAVATH